MMKIILLSIFSLVLFTGCHGVGGQVRVGGSYSYPQHMPPAHGFRQHYRYHYYPNAEIYFDIGRNMYFYLDSRNQWSFSVNLPIHLRHHLHNGYVELEMDNERPYSRHKYHKNKYNNREYRNKLKYKYKKQRIENKQRYKYQEQKQNIKQNYKHKEQRFESKQRDKYQDKKQRVKQKYKDKEQRYEERQRNKYEKKKKLESYDKDKYEDDEDDRRKKGRRDERN